MMVYIDSYHEVSLKFPPLHVTFFASSFQCRVDTLLAKANRVFLIVLRKIIFRNINSTSKLDYTRLLIQFKI